MTFRYFIGLFTIAATALSGPPSLAQVHTDYEGWRTTRTDAQCATYRNASDFYQTRVLFIASSEGKKFLSIKLDASKYPGWVRGAKEREMSVIISNSQNVAHRLQVRMSRLASGRDLNIILEEDIIPYLLDGSRIQITYPNDISQNVSIEYGNLVTGIQSFEQCERIRTGSSIVETQTADPSLDELPPFERAKRVCERELKQTGGLAAADNPYVLDGRRYANACEAAQDYAYRKVTKFRKVE